MRRAPVAALAAVVCSAALAGCTEDSSAGPTTAPSPGTSSGSSTTAEPTTSTSPTPSTPPTDPPPPVLPALAKEQSTAGAKAFVRFYIAVLNYSWTELQSRFLTAASADDCDVCQLISRRIDATNLRGGYQINGEWSPRRIYRLPGQSAARPKFLVTIDIGAGRWKPGRGKDERKIASSQVTNEIDLSWTSHGWETLDLRTT